VNFCLENDKYYYVITMSPVSNLRKVFNINSITLSKIDGDPVSTEHQSLEIQEAKQRVKKMIKIKTRKFGWRKMELSKVPSTVKEYFVAPIESFISQEDMLELVKRMGRERYVFFSDNTGLEHIFDKGLEYVAYLSDDDDLLYVEADNGEFHHCLSSRFCEIRKTEYAEEAASKFAGKGLL